jgi:hypothetical protein
MHELITDEHDRIPAGSSHTTRCNLLLRFTAKKRLRYRPASGPAAGARWRLPTGDQSRPSEGGGVRPSVVTAGEQDRRDRALRARHAWKRRALQEEQEQELDRLAIHGGKGDGEKALLK